MNLEDIEHDIIDAASMVVVHLDNDRANAALKEAERLKVLANELFMECWHRHHVSGVGPV